MCSLIKYGLFFLWIAQFEYDIIQCVRFFLLFTSGLYSSYECTVVQHESRAIITIVLSKRAYKAKIVYYYISCILYYIYYWTLIVQKEYSLNSHYITNCLIQIANIILNNIYCYQWCVWIILYSFVCLCVQLLLIYV